MKRAEMKHRAAGGPVRSRWTWIAVAALLVTTVAGTLGVTAAPVGAADTEALTINGDYEPISGDFNGDGYGDVFWYAPGRAPDHVWLGNAAGWSARAERPVTVNGRYFAFAGDFNGDGMDDILWYPMPPEPGPVRPSSSAQRATTSGMLSVLASRAARAARSAPTSASAPAPSPVIVWTATGDGAFRSRQYSAPAPFPNAFPILGRFDADATTDIFWYAPGSAPDQLWTGRSDGAFDVIPQQVYGVYYPVVADLDGNGVDDVLWAANLTSGGASEVRSPVWFSPATPSCRAGCFAKTATMAPGGFKIPVRVDADGDGRDDIFWVNLSGRWQRFSRSTSTTGSATFDVSAARSEDLAFPVVRRRGDREELVMGGPAGVETWRYDIATGRFDRAPFGVAVIDTIPIVGVHRGPTPDEDILLYGPGTLPDLATYVPEAS